MTQQEIERINALSRKAKTVGLTPEEQQEQTVLRRMYINSVLGNLQEQLEHTYIQDESGRKRKLKRKEK